MDDVRLLVIVGSRPFAVPFTLVDICHAIPFPLALIPIAIDPERTPP
jgi:hypothetical protein